MIAAVCSAPMVISTFIMYVLTLTILQNAAALALK